MKGTTTRGRQQVLFDYLPEKVFDYSDGVITKVEGISGTSRGNTISGRLVLHRIAELARAWPAEFRPALDNEVLGDLSKFVFIEPDRVNVELFPRVFQCDSRTCGFVVDASSAESTLPTKCPRCNEGRMRQVRFLKAHRCGFMEPLRPPPCSKCHSTKAMCLDTRGSERFSSFRWICRNCSNQIPIFPGKCPACVHWDSDAELKMLDVVVHRASRAYIAHTTTLLNVPVGDLDSFLQSEGWEVLVVGKCLDVDSLKGRTLGEIAGVYKKETTASPLAGVDLNALLNLSQDQVMAELKRLQSAAATPNASLEQVSEALRTQYGLPAATVKDAGMEILERVLLDEKLISKSDGQDVSEVVAPLGVSRARLIDDFPILLASYGYTRIEAQPSRRAKGGVLCRLNPFPRDNRNGGRFPVFVDETKADAVFFYLDPIRVFRWLEANGVISALTPAGLDTKVLEARTIGSIGDMSFELEGGEMNQEGRVIFELCHTLAHVSVRSAALLCGLERTSISEYLLPRSLCFGIFCNHRFGSTIGALTALYEQSMPEFVQGILSGKKCVYDPVCSREGGTCHACTHLAETSCRYFNLELSRAVLFGGKEAGVGNIRVGFFDPAL